MLTDWTFRRILPAGLALGLALSAGIPAPAGEEEVRVQGEILDLACYIAHEAKGESHKKCALTCVRQGQPMGLLTDQGKVYILYADHDDPQPFESAKSYAGTRVEISGAAGKQGGLEGISVHSVRPL